MNILPFIFLFLTFVAFIFNLLGLMQIIPLYITLPLLFISIYLTVYTYTQRKVYRGMR